MEPGVCDSPGDCVGHLAGPGEVAGVQVQGPRVCHGPRGVRPHRAALPVRQEALRVHGVWES